MILALFRIVIIGILALFIGIFGIIFSLFRPNHPNNFYLVTHTFVTRLSPFLGIKVECRIKKQPTNRYIYICNHQSNFDMLTLPKMIMPRTVCIGKSELKKIPIFNIYYWLTGNIYINRKQASAAKHTLANVVEKIKSKNISIWLFPEGTRNKGKGLLPFKKGSFHLAIDSNTNIIPIVSSTYHIDLKKWNNGLVIIEMLEPIDINQYNKDSVSELSTRCHTIMMDKIANLDAEVATRTKNKE